MNIERVTFIAHGSSKPEAIQFLKNLIAEIDDSGRVNIGFFDFGAPDIPTAIQEHVQNNAQIIRVIPLFIVPGKHITQDIPPIIEEVTKNNPNVEIILEDKMGSRPEFKELLKKFAFSLATN